MDLRHKLCLRQDLQQVTDFIIDRNFKNIFKDNLLITTNDNCTSYWLYLS